MSEMVERVARAICVVAKGPDYPDADYYGKPGDPWRKWWESFVPEARAAIAAMREPTEAMVYAAESVIPFSDSSFTFPIMIDAALNDQKAEPSLNP